MIASRASCRRGVSRTKARGRRRRDPSTKDFLTDESGEHTDGRKKKPERETTQREVAARASTTTSGVAAPRANDAPDLAMSHCIQQIGFRTFLCSKELKKTQFPTPKATSK